MLYIAMDLTRYLDHDYSRRSVERSLGGIGGFVFWTFLAALNYISPERVWETVKDFLLQPYTLDAEASWTVFTHFSGFAIFVFLADRSMPTRSHTHRKFTSKKA